MSPSGSHNTTINTTQAKCTRLEVTKLLHLVEILTRLKSSPNSIGTEGTSCQNDLSPPVSTTCNADNVAKSAANPTATFGGDTQPDARAASQQWQTGGAES
jgi:hypothetical protein